MKEIKVTWYKRTFPWIACLVAFILDILYFWHQFYKDVKFFGIGHIKTFSLYWWLRFKHGTLIKRFFKFIKYRIQIVLFEAADAVETFRDELFLARVILPFRLINYFVTVFIVLCLYLHHDYIIEIRSYEMFYTKDWNDVLELYRFNPSVWWWVPDTTMIKDLYFAQLIILNLYFWPSLFFVRVYRWLSEHAVYLSLLWFVELEITFESYVADLINYCYSHHSWAYWPLAFYWTVVFYFFGSQADMDEYYEIEGEYQEGLDWEKTTDMPDPNKFWFEFFDPLSNPLHSVEEELEARQLRMESDNLAFAKEATPEELARHYHPATRMYYQKNYSYEDFTTHLYPDGTAVSHETELDNVSFAQAFEDHLNSGGPRSIDTKTFDPVFDHANRYALYKSEWMHEGAGGKKITVAFIYTSYRDLYTRWKLKSEDIQNSYFFWTGRSLIWKGIYAAICQFIVFRYFRHMRGVVGRYTPYNTRFDLISNFLKKKEYRTLLYIYLRGNVGHYVDINHFLKPVNITADPNAHLVIGYIKKSLKDIKAKKRIKVYNENKLDEYFFHDNALKFFLKTAYLASRIQLFYGYYSGPILLNKRNFFIVRGSNKKFKLYVLESRVTDFLNETYQVTDFRFILKVCWLRIKQFFRWIHPVNWWRRRKALKALIRFERESRALVRNKRKNFKFFMVDKSTKNKEKNNHLDKHEYPNDDQNSTKK